MDFKQYYARLEKADLLRKSGQVTDIVGQMIIGSLEMVGGIITADGITRREGEFNIEVGSQHQETNKNLTAIDEAEDSETEKS